MSTNQHLAFTARTACLAGLVLLSAPTRGHAQLNSPLARESPLLNRADLALADAAAHKLLDPLPAPFGTVATWSNVASGNSGAITMGRAYEKDGNNCRTVRWHDSFKRGDDRTVVLDTCRVSGVWRLM